MDIKKKLLEFQREEITEYHFYIITLILLILPYILFKNYLIALLFTILIGVLIVFVFTFLINYIPLIDVSTAMSMDLCSSSGSPSILTLRNPLKISDIASSSDIPLAMRYSISSFAIFPTAAS